MNNQLAINREIGIQSIIGMVKDSLHSEHSKRAYEKALTDFMGWFEVQGGIKLTKATVQKYMTGLVDSGLSSASVNLKMSAVKKLCSEAVDNQLLDQSIATGISKIRGVPSRGTRVGNWLDKDQARALLNAPDTITLRGKRDKAILAVMLGGGLRRQEVANLRFINLAMRDSRWVLADFVGKCGRVRSVPVARFVITAINEWVSAGGFAPTGLIFRSIDKYDRIGNNITAQAIGECVVKFYARKLGWNLSSHDCRRTFAKLALAGKSPIEQISKSLGHSSILTTQLYLGVSQDFIDAPGDRLGLDG